MIDTLEAERQTFLDDIIANPGDDAVRLIYADWLTDHGESERAEFIRVQCELAKMPSPPCGCKNCRKKRRSLQPRERDLWLSSETFPWFPGFDGYVMLLMRPSSLGSDDPPIAVVRRGFVAEIDCDWQDWNAQADEIVGQHPIEEVRLLTDPGYESSPKFTSIRLSDREWVRRSLIEVKARELVGGQLLTLNYRHIIMALLHHTWPTVGKFTLPEAQS